MNEEINENYCGIINPEILNGGDDVLWKKLCGK